MSKYHRWYFQLMDVARSRQIPSCYTEVHHVMPRSLGGSDDSSNLVRLTYREHFIAHWLLTKITTGGGLRKMQRALFAMTMPSRGARLISGWQIDAAKRAVRDLELDPIAEEAWRARFRQIQQAKIELRKARGLPVNRQQAKRFQRKRARSR
jgi:hypothetical protein